MHQKTGTRIFSETLFKLPKIEEPKRQATLEGILNNGMTLLEYYTAMKTAIRKSMGGLHRYNVE